MSDTRQRLTAVIDAQPDDATYEEIVRELIFEGMIDRGLSDVRQGRTVADDDVERRIRTWQS